MSTAIMTRKGPVTIPAKIRAALGIKAGDRLELIQVGPSRFERVTVTLSVTTLKGLVRKFF